MLSRPISYRDLYLFATGLSTLGFILTLSLYPRSELFWIATLYPFSFVTVHLVRLPTEYTEEALCNIPLRTYSLFTGLSVIIITIGVFIGYGGRFVTTILAITLLTIGFFYWFCGEVSTAYESVGFGFREKLPNATLWKSATVFLHLHQEAINNYTRLVWRQFAIHRFETLSSQNEKPYANTKIAQRYERAISETPIGAAVPTTRLSSILADFTKQPCSHCNEHKSVEDMYFITNGGEVNNAYCFSCLDKITPGETNYATYETTETTKETTKTTGQKTTTTETENEDIQFALDVFDFDSVAEVTTEELRVRYRKKVQEVHPDSGGSTEEFKLVKNAHAKLQSVTSSSDSSAP